jgi:dTDP-4-amino-4,6-dideoxygalactose transaminase
LLPQANEIANKRISNAAILDDGLREIPGISLPERRLNEKIVYHLYMFRAENRDELLAYLLENNIEAKIHYPIPIYRQKGLSHLGHQFGDFPQSDEELNQPAMRSASKFKSNQLHDRENCEIL